MRETSKIIIFTRGDIMGKRKYHAPHRSSLGVRRKRANSTKPKVGGWPPYSGAPKLKGFPAIKAGMTQLLTKEDNKSSHKHGIEKLEAVTILEAPPIVLFGMRGYKYTPYGKKIVAEVRAESPYKFMKKYKCLPKEYKEEEQLEKFKQKLNEMNEIRALVHTQPALTRIGTKKPQIFEIPIGANSVQEAFDYAVGKLKQEIQVDEFISAGDYVDVIGITKGKGFQGPVKRHGIKILPRKTKGEKRAVGSIGAWHPARVTWTVPRYGQLGFFRRTEYNKRVMQIGSDGKEVTPKGGIPGYGIVGGKAGVTRYVLLKGSVPGVKKRTVMLRLPIRPKKVTLPEPTVTLVSTEPQN